MHPTRPSLLAFAPLLAFTVLAACGDSAATSASDAGTTNPGTTNPGTTTPGTTAAPTTSDGSISDTGTTTTSTSTTDALTEGITTTTTTVTTTATTTTATTTTTTDSTTTTTDSTGTTMDTDTGVLPCGRGGGGDLEFSYIWISNTGESTLTKLNTVTLVEEARYITRPDKSGSPSRTSVNLSGDVVVANRNGGITKFYARQEDCQETNGTPGIQTSTGKLDVLLWDDEECRAWHTPLAATSNRPVAWTSGVQDPVTCAWNEKKVWTSTSQLGQAGSMQVLRLNGDTGAVEDTVPLPAVDLGSWGAYGGAVDGENNFWMSTHGSASPPTLTRVRFDTLEVTTWPVPQGLAPYGITVDTQGRPWLAGYQGGVARFTPLSETWDVVPGVTGLGLQADGEGNVWVGKNPGPGVTAIDTDTLAVTLTIPLPASVTKGVSIDFYGNVWVVDMAQSAYRVDPMTQQFDVYDGLTQAYTYSDMTGWGLSNVIPQ